MTDVFAVLDSARFLPLWTPESVADAQRVAAIDVPVVEVALRTPEAMDALESLAARTNAVVGAGTVVRREQVDEAAERGASFIVSPGLSEEVVTHARDRGLAVLPGVSTPSDLMRAHALGLSRVKLFPAGLLGGVAWISALAAPFPGMRFMPSGGVTAENAETYLAHPAVFAVSGSWMLA
ncbi:bifunctional 4-hydroxy-2-oxoglutarate aldolase/2-dehydro-3-deoxy-phosphogluconate aldolase [Amycolatopsis acidicola]|uniref:Bifunctional 4-hydroxy-2-oxoglutarate aldolase/2-dehydro-3-deoxy-phosphogluconate aldolase n=1 Tax=Amycolatopsis acidicola TaxID=2596893 RepID=A0A5N0V364_9PSEU|nr:bifunctional 4-hydroxy-2-oxoglutarate aldolase/2-dehydro-3-deoxy-phosphogluconate aldolase [Amycolatopsis acidicola]KAA9159060.1 bifunctional 4-hydroxy-2-oxoglutarate aldolase/2-dehydro-3-deoxy-phosphogluconate aldolase [Amycolatopsis acidicola]